MPTHYEINIGRLFHTCNQAKSQSHINFWAIYSKYKKKLCTNISIKLTQYKTEQKIKQDTRRSKLDETLQQLLQRCIIVNRPGGIHGDSGVLYPLSFSSYINPIPIRECQIRPPHWCVPTWFENVPPGPST